MRMDMVELIVSVITLIITVVISWKQLRLEKEMHLFAQQQDERDEKFRRDSVNTEAIAFIQKYNQDGVGSEIRLLPLCVIAYKYDPTYPYRRLMYRDFCSRTETVREEILARCNMYYDCSEDKLFKRKMYDLVQKNRLVIWNSGNHFNYFYDNCKYFTPALTEYGSKLCPVGGFEFENKVRGSLELTNDNNAESIRDELDECFKTAKSIDATYLCCLVAKYMALVHGECIDDDSVESSADYSGDLYMEDLFLDALLYVYLYRIDTDKNT